MKDPKFIVIDLFCGAGGTTTGFTMTDDAIVIACVNHDYKAIQSHWRNHPDVEHFNEDITKLYGYLRTWKWKDDQGKLLKKVSVFFKSPVMMRLLKLVELYQAFYPNAKLILWASLECTNFSKAKGGKARDADSRTLADHIPFYVWPLKPDIIQIENVVEFMAWGPLDDNGKPISKKNGQDWLRWRKDLCSFGYSDEWKELNSADFGAFTSRNRLFGMFANEKYLICWPEPTHTKNPSTGNLFESMKKWKAVKEVLDLKDEGKSIFERKKELSPKTLARIYAGLIKYVAGGKDMFIAKYYSGRPMGKVITVDGPAGTIKTSDGQSIIKANFLVNYNHSSSTNSVDDPGPTLVTRDKLGLTKTIFLSKYHGNGANVRSVDEPSPTLDTGDRIAKVDAQHWIYRNFSNGGENQSIENPAGSILSVPKMNLVHADKFILKSGYNNVGSSLEDPCPTLMASRRHHYILNPAWGGNNGDIENPCCTIVARQDKAPLYFVSVEHAPVAVAVYEDDCEEMIKIKEFMVLYDIVDIKMRMLKVLELLKIQGFPSNYILEGNQTDQKKFIGNSVVPLVVKFWTEALSQNLKQAA